MADSPLKYAMITGASRGIGKAIAIQLAKDSNYTILLNYRSNKEAATETLKAIHSLDRKAELIQFDVSDFNETQAAIESWRNSHLDATIEVLVNNAGVTADQLMLWMEASDWNKVINTNLHGFFNVTKPILEQMLLNRYGRIINIVSLAGLKGNAGQTNYAAAKGAIIAATKSLAQEIGKRNITVNAVAPGFITTDMTEGLDEVELKKLIPLNRFGKPEEVAHLVSFLASEKSSYITGEVININGGIYS